MNVIDHMSIGILPLPLHIAILDNRTTFAQYQLTQHHNRHPPTSSTKLQPLMTVYHDKIEIEPLHKHTLLEIDMLPDVKFHKLYSQV